MTKVTLDDWTSDAALSVAWQRVRRNLMRRARDGSGVVRLEMDPPSQVQALQQDLRLGLYRPGKLQRIPKHKNDGGVRWLCIPTQRDRVAQGALSDALDRRLDGLMSPASFAYRAGLSVEAAAGRVTMLRLQGWDWAVHLDIETFFDRVPHQGLIDALRDHTDFQTRSVLGRWLSGFGRWRRGLAQGSPISPVLANWYLSPFDHEMNRGQTRVVRYADDILLLTRSRTQAEAMRARAESALRGLRLKPNAAKTRIASFDEGIAFLGLWFTGSGVQPLIR
ncbi:reverse transcriptase domain-containing protein [Puniceibacterium sediminis]|nr:reverse transcriptase domain-containing protein [Puniceibacterium sediminis]